MSSSHRTLLFVLLLLVPAGLHAQTAAGDAARGAQLFRACAACHSLVPDQNMSGPSLAGVVGRKAGMLASFDRYSPALKASGVTWNPGTLDAWLAAPDKLVPDNRMPFDGIADAKARADLIAFLQQQNAGALPNAQSAQAGGMDMGRMGMGGMGMGGSQLENLKALGPEQQVQAIRLCRDSYRITTKDGKENVFWEPNLRLKTDSSSMGPPAGAPVLVAAGMMGDRADVIFAAPEEISRAITHACP